MPDMMEKTGAMVLYAVCAYCVDGEAAAMACPKAVAKTM